MQRSIAALLGDIAGAADDIAAYTANLSSRDYEENGMLKAAVERKFTVIGEALMRLAAISPETANEIGQAREIIGFRHVLTHGYEIIEDRSVWTTLQNDLPHLRRTVHRMLARIQDSQSG